MNNAYGLRTLFWEATGACNAYCEFCGSRCGEIAVKDLDGQTVCRAFAQIADRYESSRIMINVTGGEPLLRKDLFDVMEQADRMGFPWGMVTNGTLITPDIIQRMQETHMRTISVSVDGIGEMHNSIRRLPGGFERIVQNLEALARADFLDCIQITTVVSRRNIDSLEEMYDYFCSLPINSWRIATMDPIGRGKDAQELQLTTKDRRRVLDFLKEHAFCEKMEITTSCSHFLGEEDTLYRSHAFHCGTGKSVVSILANGDIFVCPNVPRKPEWIQGNICRDNFCDVWENGFEWFRQDLNRKKGACSTCRYWEKCKGDSVHTWDEEKEEPKVCFSRLLNPEENAETVDGFIVDDMQCRKSETESEMFADIMSSLKKNGSHLVGYRISYGSSSKKKVYFLPDAAREIWHYFHWGKKHPRNISELMVGLVGKRDGENIFVEMIFPVFLEKRGREEGLFTQRSYADSLLELQTLEQDAEEGESLLHAWGKLELVGYAHSHPGELDAMMSTPDMVLHNRMCELREDYHITAILNPQKKDFMVFWDSAWSPVDVILLMEEHQVINWK